MGTRSNLGAVIEKNDEWMYNINTEKKNNDADESLVPKQGPFLKSQVSWAEGHAVLVQHQRLRRWEKSIKMPTMIIWPTYKPNTKLKKQYRVLSIW